MKLLFLSLIALASIARAPSALHAQDAERFDVAAVRRNTSAETGAQMRIEPSGQVSIENYTLFHIVRNAYGVQPFQIIVEDGAPDWFDRDRWNILARPAAGDVPSAVRQQMLQNLLADRFRLVISREQRELPVYALVVARADGKLGAQIAPAGDECEAARRARERGETTPPQLPARGFCGTRAAPGAVSTGAVRLADFARNLAPLTGRFVIDRTGLAGPYDLDLKWTPDPGQGSPSAAALTDGTSLFAALQEQLGLRLEPQRAPVDVLVVKSAQQPVVD